MSEAIVTDAESWGSWSLGDLGDLLQKVAGLLGPAREVSSVELLPFGDEAQTPEVKVFVPQAAVAERLLHKLLCSEYVVELRRPAPGAHWTALAAGCVISVEIETGETR